MFSNRYKDNGKETLVLNDLQKRLRNQINLKVRDGFYKFETVKCGCCRNSNSKPLAWKDRYGLKCPIVICTECGLIFTSPRMTLQSYMKFYDCEYRSLYHGLDMPLEDLYRRQLYRGNEIARFFLDNGYEIHDKKILEVGCGSGGTLSHFRDTYNCQVFGCDYGSEGIKYGSKYYNLEIFHGDLSLVKLPWEPDIIIYSHVFEHILDIKAECRIISNVLPQHGVLYVEVPSVKNIHNQYDLDLMKYFQNAHVYHFSLRSLINVMKVNGFELQIGNEFVKSIFVKSENNKSIKLENDYKEVLDYLKRTERSRILIKFKNFISNFRSLSINSVKKLKLINIFRKFRYEFFD